MKTGFLLLLILALYSCHSANDKPDKYTLRPSDVYLNFRIDDNTQLPKFCLWTFEEGGKEYLTFPNRGREILFYDISSEQLVKKVSLELEGNNGVGNIYSFYPMGFNDIYIADVNNPLLYVVDTTGVIHSRIRYEGQEKTPPVPAFLHTITYSPLYVFGDSLYIPQSVNYELGVENSPFGIMFQKSSGQVTGTPLKYMSLNGIVNNPNATGGVKVSTCFDGESFVYSHELFDTIYKVKKQFSKIEKYKVSSKYIRSPKAEVVSNAGVDKILKRKCELPAYGNLIYDKYRKVYYRFVFLSVEFSDENNFMEIYHNGRKQFSIIILDADMNYLGETVFPEYTYNPYLLFIRQDGLYLSTSHYKHPEFDENILRFQKIELVEK